MRFALRNIVLISHLVIAGLRRLDPPLGRGTGAVESRERVSHANSRARSRHEPALSHAALRPRGPCAPGNINSHVFASWRFPSCGSMALRYILLQCVMDSIVRAGLSQAGT